MIKDFFFAFRMIGTRPWFSMALIATLAIGIGINAAVFTLVHAVLYKPAPVPDGDRLVVIPGQKLDQPNSRTPTSYSDFLEYRSQNESFESIEAVLQSQAIVSETKIPPERLRLGKISPHMFEMLKVSPILGHGFTDTESEQSIDSLALISHQLWTNRYNNLEHIVGQSILVNNQPATIIGIMPEDFLLPYRELLWMPLPANSDQADREKQNLTLYGILKEGVTAAQANADLSSIALRLESEYKDTHENRGVIVETLHQRFNGGPIRIIFLVMLGAVGFVLLIACANVANMLLGRAITRRYEISVRAAMGASRFQIIRQLLCESIVISLIGGLLGLAIAYFGIGAFDSATMDVGKPYWILFEMDYASFGYIAAISILSGMIFGLAPALRSSRVNLIETIKSGSRTSDSKFGGKLMGSLVVFQFALTFILLTGAGLMAKSFISAKQANDFIPKDELLTASIRLPKGEDQAYQDDQDILQFFEALDVRLTELPNVTHVAATSVLPGIGAWYRRIETEAEPMIDQDSAPRAAAVTHTESYLELIDSSIIEGRGFNKFDLPESTPVAIATKRFSETHWPQESAIGKRFRFLDGEEPGPWLTVVGVSGDIDQTIMDNNQPALAYLPFSQNPQNQMSLLLRTSEDPTALAIGLRETVQKLDSQLPLFQVQTLRKTLDRRIWFLNVFGAAFLIFALAALVMASVGIYAVVAQANAQRTKEIGIRMAMGATSKKILTFALRRGLTQLCIGIGIGLICALSLTHVIQDFFLVDTSPRDPLVFGTVFMLLTIIGLLACLIPARRASVIPPSQAIFKE